MLFFATFLAASCGWSCLDAFPSTFAFEEACPVTGFFGGADIPAADSSEPGSLPGFTAVCIFAALCAS
uniref:Putative secreted protein n=1 Tax=Ixodes ricinus TaxID=34613 RepID=A0A6B0U1A2_IXORI